jgi:hypothetical protein
LQTRDHSRKIIGLNQEHKFLNDLDPATVIAGGLRPPRPARPDEEGLERGTQFVVVIEQHRVRLCQALPNMLREPGAKGFPDRAVFEM